MKDVSSNHSAREMDLLRRIAALEAELEEAKSAARDTYLNGEVFAERQRAEEELKESEEKYRRLFEMESDALFLIDNETGDIIEVNSAATLMYGYTREELLARKNTDMSAESDKTRQATKEQLSKIPVRWHRKKDGTVFPVEIAATHLVWKGRESHIAAIREITERLRAMEALRESEARFKRLAENAKDLVFRYQVKAPQGYSYVNSHPGDIAGYAAEDYYADPNLAFKIVHPEDRPLLESVARGENYGKRLTMRWIHKNGSTMWTECIFLPVLDSEGSLVALDGFVHDISERKELEEQLLRAQRLETAGIIAGQVAHDFNNLLGPIVAYPELIKMRLPAGHPAIAMCDQMMEAAQQMAVINTDMLALSRRGILNQQPVDLNSLVQQILSDIQPIPADFVVETNLAEDLLPASGEPAQIVRVIANLVSNARDAMNDLGMLTIETENVYIDQPFGLYNQVGVGEYVLLTVSDTGCGIAPEIRPRIFDAFFSTKHNTRRRGSGLGLSVVQSIVVDHMGYLDLESQVGKGSRFKVYLPVHRGTAGQTEEKARIRGGRETILIVDDDALQRKVIEGLLSILGYRIELATSGEEAIARLKNRCIDLLILDMIMPDGIDGAETYRRAVEMQPGQKAIFLSGFAQSDRVRQAQAQGGGAFLRKPVTLDVLALAVRAELDREPSVHATT